jgi:hypothetical protein
VGVVATQLRGVYVSHTQAFIGRSLSDVQEAAQLLAGEALPLALLSAILGKTGVKEKYDTCLLINLTSYDGWVEKTAKRWSELSGCPMKWKILSMTKNIVTAQYVERTLALELMEDSAKRVENIV